MEQLPKPAESIASTIRNTRCFRSGCPCGNSPKWDTFAATVDGVRWRFRVNLLTQQGSLGLVARRVNNSIPDFKGLHLPPAIERLCGYDQGLPVGLHLMSAHWQEPKLLQVAYAYEQAAGWKRRAVAEAGRVTVAG